MKTICNIGVCEIDPGQEWEAHFAPGLLCFGRTEAEAIANAESFATAAGANVFMGGMFAARELSGIGECGA